MREYLTKRHRRLPPAARRANCHLPAPRKPFNPRSEPQLHKTMDHFSGSPRYCLRLKDIISFLPICCRPALRVGCMHSARDTNQVRPQYKATSLFGDTHESHGSHGAMEPCNVGVISGHVRPGCRKACRLTRQTQQRASMSK